jgi:hypothetical protein
MAHGTTSFGGRRRRRIDYLKVMIDGLWWRDEGFGENWC